MIFFTALSNFSCIIYFKYYIMGSFLIFFLHSIVKDMFKKKTKTNQVLIN